MYITHYTYKVRIIRCVCKGRAWPGKSANHSLHTSQWLLCLVCLVCQVITQQACPRRDGTGCLYTIIQ